MGLKKCDMSNLNSLRPDAKQGSLLIIWLNLYEFWTGNEVSDECREQMSLKRLKEEDPQKLFQLSFRLECRTEVVHIWATKKLFWILYSFNIFINYLTKQVNKMLIKSADDTLDGILISHS